MKKRRIALAAFVVSAGLLGLGAASGQNQPVKLEFWAHWLSAVRRPTIDKIIGTWNKRNPNIQVNYTGVPFDQIITKTLAGVAAGNAPDVAVLQFSQTRIRASKNQLTDLSALGADQLESRYFQGAWDSGNFNGKQYALPFVTDTRMLFYRKDLFREAGLDPERGPRTWAELESMAEKLTKRDGNTLTRVGFHPAIGGESGLELWVYNAGGSLFDAKGENPTINNPVALRALQWMKSWTDKYGGSGPLNAFRAGFGGGAGPTDPFVSGKVAMQVRNSPFITELARNAPNVQYGVVPIPTPSGKAGKADSLGGGFNVEIPRGTKYPQQALAFARYFTTEAAAVWVKEQNDFPASKAAVTALSSPNALKIAANANRTRLQIAPLYAPLYGTPLAKAEEDVLIGNRDPKAALDEAQATVEKMVVEGKK
jgi:multiple sugar transport system substrate-binding protein